MLKFKIIKKTGEETRWKKHHGTTSELLQTLHTKYNTVLIHNYFLGEVYALVPVHCPDSIMEGVLKIEKVIINKIK